MLQSLDESNLDAVARGCAMLAAGGGGDPETARVMAHLATSEHGPVPLVRLEDMADDALIMPCGLIGSPTIATERLWSGDEGRALVETVEQLRGRPVAALMAFEIAGVNGLLPVTWAARLGLPLVDADGMGRAFPRLHQQTMHLAGVPASPIALTDGRDNTVVLRSLDHAWEERLATRTATNLGGVCAAALFCMSADLARTATISGSITRAHSIGTGVAELPTVILAEGRIAAIERHLGRGTGQGYVAVRGTGPDDGRQIRLELQNEFMLVIEDGELLATVPDIISVLALETRAPLHTENLQHGARATVLASAAPAAWTTEAGLELVGPAAFGYDVAYTPAGAVA